MQILDLKEEGSSLVQKIYRNPPDFTLAFNGLRPINGQYFLADKLEIPHIAWLVDASYYFPELVLSKFNILISPDQTSADQLKEWGAKNSYFIPHGFAAEEAAVSEKERIYPITFLGTLMDPDEILQKWREELPKHLCDQLIEASEKVLEIPELTISDLFHQIEIKNRALFEKMKPETPIEIIRALDYLVRAEDRLRLLKALKEFPVHIFGNAIGKKSWAELIDLKDGQYTLHPSVDFEEGLDLIRQSQILLNSSPMFKQGAHERIFNGLGLGALVASNETPWIRRNFTEEEVITYKTGNFAPFLEKINTLLSSKEKLNNLAKKGQQNVLKNHTWDVRAKQLLEILNNYFS